MFSMRFFIPLLLILFCYSTQMAHALTSDDLTTMETAGTALKHSTTNFDIYYTNDCTSYPDDCTTTSNITALGVELEETRTGEYSHGFDIPACRFRVFVLDSSAYGISRGQNSSWDTGTRVCNWQILEFDAALVNATEPDDISWRRNVTTHEFFHSIQFGYRYDSNWWDAPSWTIESQAVAVSDKIFTLNDEAEQGYFSNSRYYLLWPTTLTELVYGAGLFWNYAAEQYGATVTEPGRGMDAFKEYWNGAKPFGSAANEFEVFDTMLDRLGAPGSTFGTVYRDFVVANYAKDLTGTSVPTKYKYFDEQQPPGTYGPVHLQENTNPTAAGHTVAGQDYVSSWQPKYYSYKRDSQTSDTMSIDVSQTTSEQLYFVLLTVTNGEITNEIRSEGTDFSQSLTGLTVDDDIVLIVSGLDNSGTTPTKYTYSLSSGEPLSVDILSPAMFDKVQVGPIDNPQKFLAIVEVLQSASPLLGLTSADFTSEVNNIAADVILSAYVDGLYFLEIQAPVQPTSITSGNLEVTVGSKTSIANLSVAYTDTGETWPATDTMVVVDRSGSMSSGDKIDAAKAAARLYVDTLVSGSRAGLVQYDTTVDLLQGLDDISTIRDPMILQIDAITPRNLTAIGGALRTAQTELTANGVTGNPKHIFLLTDGRENQTPDMEEVFWADIYPVGTRLDVVAIGADAQVGDLELYTLYSGGEIYFAFDPASGTLASDLGDIYRSVASVQNVEERIFSTKGIKGSQAGWTISEPIIIEDTPSATISFSYRGSRPYSKHAGPRLVAPDSTIVQPTRKRDKQASMGADHYGHAVWQLNSPAPGTYTFQAESAGEIEYMVEASNRSSVSLRIFFGGLSAKAKTDKSTKTVPRFTGDEVQILAFLSDKKPIVRANITANIIAGASYTNFESWSLPLFDDGNHGDGSANDGVYGNLFTRTSGLGTTAGLPDIPYAVKVVVSGESNQGNAFKREKAGAFHIVKDPKGDTDKDSMPDKWEKLHGLDPSSDSGDGGANGDPDKDGLTNIQEYEFGTSPTQSDTDRGGESDGSEIRQKRDPYDPNDDKIKPPVIRVIPGNKEVTVHFGPRSTHKTLNLFRSKNEDYGYSRLRIFPTSEIKEYIDKNLTNDTKYFYKANAVGFGDETSRYSPVVMAKPKEDPVRPWGRVQINNGEAITASVEVALNLKAADDVVEIMISNSPRFDDSHWQTFTQSVQWTLADYGRQHIFVKFKDRAGNTGGELVGSMTYLTTEYATDNIMVEKESSITIYTIILVLIIILILVIILVNRSRASNPGIEGEEGGGGGT